MRPTSMRQQQPDRRRRLPALVLDLVGVLVLGADTVISVPLVISVLRDPTSHEAQDAGMTAIVLLLPIAMIGIACILVAWLLWRTRAGGVALVTACLVVVLVVLNIGGIPVLAPAIAVAVAGACLALWFAVTDWVRGPTA